MIICVGEVMIRKTVVACFITMARYSPGGRPGSCKTREDSRYSAEILTGCPLSTTPLYRLCQQFRVVWVIFFSESVFYGGGGAVQFHLVLHVTFHTLTISELVVTRWQKSQTRGRGIRERRKMITREKKSII
jgi:hypothetical protein